MMSSSERQYASSVHTVDQHQRVARREAFDEGCALVTKRGFKPSDMFDPQKKQFLTHLSYKLFPNEFQESQEAPAEPPEEPLDDLDTKSIFVGDKEVDLNKIFTPAPDAEQHIIKKERKFEKTFASSAFYVPGMHPTVKEQMDLARAISKSLSDSSNQMSKGQSMYVSRKKRSVKWVHEGRGRNTSNSSATPTPVASHDTPYRPPSSSRNQKTYPRSALKHTSHLPKMEPFPLSVPLTQPEPTQGAPLLFPVPASLSAACAPPKSPRPPLVCGPKFNVAPRGWGEMQAYYRPVALDAAGGVAAAYSDY